MWTDWDAGCSWPRSTAGTTPARRPPPRWRICARAATYEPVFSVDPELYFDYQYTRPHVAIDGDGKRELRWPEATLLEPVKPGRGMQLWLLTGVEPARAWQAFSTEFVDVALREDITGFVALGSMMSDVPHTRPISIFAGSDNEQVRDDARARAQHVRGPGRHPERARRTRPSRRHPLREPLGERAALRRRPHARRRRRRSRCSTASRTSRARRLPRGELVDAVGRVGGIDRCRRRGRRGDDRVHPPARAHARHVGLPRGLRRRDRPGVRALPAPRRQRRSRQRDGPTKPGRDDPRR